ncbi:MAG: EthD domain-containing protein [Myxococcota bacterium]|nr:EthD domain-containing protein [Myxococcota bacterium]
MIKLSFCLHRLPHLDREAFQRYWRDTHGPLVRERARALAIERYVQVHAVEDPLQALLRESRGAPEAYDGIAELWWQDRETLAAAMASPEGQRAAAELLEDERRFIDLARSPLWISEEHPILAGEADQNSGVSSSGA